MNNALLEKLLAFYEEDPTDPFTIYALALEYLKHDPARAGQLFRELLRQHPTYLPTYYHAAQYFAQQEATEPAKETYAKGIELALQQGNTKAHTELSRAYRAFLDELEDW
ncbi:hypothetical protein GCM10027275_15410 [Rhabdobacter roseus]|uniref:Tetratricopeptide (TPR) repeat protein n=1 Tax=Rhabdobacter roseus TaxID=1655419 RepID=A0A840TJ87_9BACT|nr:tetratricopeptide repeat protein [Rhabdobacter roseus]MBB5283461.1 tetratricopeptide (TPR) repeat protein [Rhabdobacter roseus]